MRPRVMFVCTHNSARSQMAEGLVRALSGGRVEASSAGTVATAVRPEAVSVMAELGIDISGQTSKTLDRFLGRPFDWVITVCDAAAEACPAFPGPARRLHWSLPDPGRAAGTEAERLEAFRAVRDALRRHVTAWLQDVAPETAPEGTA